MSFNDIYNDDSSNNFKIMPGVILERFPVACGCFDSKGRLISANKRFLLLFNIDDISEFEALLLDCQFGGKPIIEYFYQHIQEAQRVGEIHFELCFNELALCLDITLKCESQDLIVACMHEIGRYKEAINSAQVKEQEANEINEMLIGSAPFVMNLWDDKYNLVATSDQAAKIFGLKDKDQYISCFTELSPDIQPCGMTSSEAFDNMLKSALESGYARFEWMHRTLDGEPLPMEITLVRFKRQGRYMLVSYSSDLRPVKAMIEKERQSFELAQMFVDSAPFFVETWDSNLNLIGCNKTATKMFGLTDADEYVRKFGSLSPKYQPCGTSSDEKVRSVIGRALREGSTRLEWIHIGPDGEPLPVDVTYVHLKYGDDDIVVGYNQDLRPLRFAMEKERESEERAKILLDTSPIAIISFDESLNVVDCNLAAINLFLTKPDKSIIETYYEQEDLEFCPYTDCDQYEGCGRDHCRVRKFFIKNHRHIFPGYKRNKEAVENFIAQYCLDAAKSGMKKSEYDLTTLYGEIIPCELTVVSVNYQGSQGFAIYIRDLREEKLREIAEDANRAKSSFLSTISHEIRTPMNAILGMTEIQLLNTEIDPQTKEVFEKIHISGDLLLNIINDLLDLSKIEAGKLDLTINKYEAASFISNTAQLNMMRIGSKDIDFKLCIDENMPAYMVGDELRVKQILNNLLSNAFKYTEKGIVTLSMSLIESESNNNEVILSIVVQDTGVGMTKDQISKVFEDYSRFNVESNRSTEGTGLGMSITRNLVTLMKGEIFIESEPDKGSTFTVRLPQGKIGDSILGKEAVENLSKFRTRNRAQMKRSQVMRELMPYGKVLIVDDVDINITVAKGLLAPYKLQIDEASSGFKAIEKIKNGEVYDVVLMDHMMPGMDGMETTKKLREMGYNNPIVALTANAISGQAEIFFENGFDDFISKPIDVRSMNKMLNKLIRDKHPAKVVDVV
ncbi:MAG: ATP-binding protein [Defluviitaleaceae bacterium]|nr:ATP-binding protein [Defluviitaleaceae bacterium]